MVCLPTVVSGLTQTCPQPFEQHFWMSGQSWSFEQSSLQIPKLPLGTAGQTPSFAANQIKETHFDKVFLLLNGTISYKRS